MPRHLSVQAGNEKPTAWVTILSRSPREVQAQLLEVVRQIAPQDFPDPWSNLLPDALTSLGGGDPARMYGSLQVLRKVASSLEFTSEHASTMQVRST